ncbi:carboxypeptidase-like regulatory domain-containing protein, partial [Methanobrevibacter sp.]|uniref:carboxypeptidase-like regulatory domain-containing protein n=1 Tax=Methanobrevibacter sp. TaxID=66852 RepID=UPI003890FF06
DPSSLNIPGFDSSSLNVSDILSKIDWSKLNIPGFDSSSLNVSDILSKIDWSKLNIPDFNDSAIDDSDIADLIVPNVTKYYHGPERLEATYTMFGQPVDNVTIHFYISDVEYKATTNSEGKASVALNLNSGVYNIMARSLILFKEATVTIKPTIEGKDVVKYYKNATHYYAKFVDSQGNVLKNTDVKFNINGVEYTRKTDASGVAKLNINLNSGTYILTATNPVTNEMRSNTIQVYGLIAENKDLTKYFKNESQYTIRLFDDQGNPVGAGVSALFNIHGVFYSRTSDENGYVTLNINLDPGDYIVTAEYNGYKVSNNIKVLPVLVASDLTKQFLDLTPFSVQLLNGHGDALINKVITFNINGVFYNRTTDLLGIARLNINLWPGVYIITSMYDEIGAVTSNKVTVTSIFG